MGVDIQTISGLDDVLEQEPEVIGAYLFGSRAQGTAREDSDTDLAIVVEDRTEKDEFYFLEKLSGVEIVELDLTVVDLRHSSPLLLQQIIKTGRPVYRRSEQDLAIFRARAASRYFDTAYLRKVQHEYMKKRIREGSYGY